MRSSKEPEAGAPGEAALPCKSVEEVLGGLEVLDENFLLITVEAIDDDGLSVMTIVVVAGYRMLYLSILFHKPKKER